MTDHAPAHARWHRALDNPKAEEPGPIRDHIEQHDSQLLFAYSEWLDSEGLVKPDHEVPSDSGGSYVSDDRPHDQLVADFLEQHKAGA